MAGAAYSSTPAAYATLATPPGSSLLADFTDGSVPSSDVSLNTSSGNASGIKCVYDSNGIGISFASGTTNQFAASQWVPSGGFSLAGASHIVMELELPQGTGTYLNDFVINIGADTSGFTNFLQQVSAGAARFPPRLLLVLPLGLMTKNGTVTDSTLAAMKKIELRLRVVSTAQNEPASLYIRRIWKARNRPVVIWSFDDGRSGVYSNALSVLNAAGMKATLFPPPIYPILGDAGDTRYMTSAQIQSLYNTYGWDVGIQEYNDAPSIPINQADDNSDLTISGTTATWVNRQTGITTGYVAGVSYANISGAVQNELNGNFLVATTPTTSSFTFDTGVVGLTSPARGWFSIPRWTQAQFNTDLDRVKSYWRALGIARGQDHIAWSSGVTDPTVMGWARDYGLKTGRITALGGTPMTGCTDPRGATWRSLMAMPGFAMDQDTAANFSVRFLIALVRGGTMHAYGHDVQPGVGTGTANTVDLTEFTAMVAQVKAARDQGLCDVLTVSQFYNRVMGVN